MKHLLVLLALLLMCAAPASAQFSSLETPRLRLVHYGVSTDDIARHAARSFENSLAYHEAFFDYTPSRRMTVFLNDWSDYGNAGADVLPRNYINLSIAPLMYAFETAPANERINSAMHHELVHVITNDKAARRDRFFRTLFAGKVAVTAEDPVSIVYSYLTAPRRYAPRWYQEGIAVFMETWMSGGLGRSLGGYDEMVFRTMVLDSSRFYDPVGLESEGKDVDFQIGANAYLYGTRFMSYLAVTYSPDHVIRWVTRSDGSKGNFTAAFRDTFGESLSSAWEDWIAFEREYQQANLARIRENPTTTFRSLSGRPLGSVSAVHLDESAGKVYAAVYFPGEVAHIAAIDVNDGSREKVADITGANLYSVSSLAFDDERRILFFTTDNNEWRELRSVDVATGAVAELLHDARIGDIAFNRADRSLWGIRHYLGISSIVRIPYPYDDWDRVHSFPYGRDLYDLAVSPDGRHVTGALAEISGHQTLIRLDTDSLQQGIYRQETIFDFGESNPESFSFSSDGRYMFGSSYYSGVSNIYRYDLAAERMEILTNAETGFFRPASISADSLIALRYSSGGFRPVVIANQAVARVGAIEFLGQEVVRKHPVVREWIAGSPGDVVLDSLGTSVGSYRGIRNLAPVSIYPIIQGYKNFVAGGLRFNFADKIGFHRLNVSTSYTPSPDLPADERLHANLTYQYLRWTLSADYNGADFYDLFGPTKYSRKGYAAEVGYEGSLLNDPPRTLNYTVSVAGYGGLERLPDYQNVRAPFSELLSARASLTYQNLRTTIGAVQWEEGFQAGLSASTNYVTKDFLPRVHGTFDVGTLLPIDHSSLWLRTAVGKSFGPRDDPFANYFFGGFGNNWVDSRGINRYRSYSSFPGMEINAIAGTTFGKALVEWALPPIRFRRAGGTSLFLKWAQLSAFASGVATNFDDAETRGEFAGVGAQVNFRIMVFSYLHTTLSFGYAVSGEGTDFSEDEFMFSLKIL